jgi:hypothetical protein
MVRKLFAMKNNNYKKLPRRDNEKDLLDEMRSTYNPFCGSKKLLKKYLQRKHRRKNKNVEIEEEE